MVNQTTEEHILMSTISAIEKHGLAKLTTRLIAEEAGVNNAALHYYYRTKEHLIEAALNQTANHMLQDIQQILFNQNTIEIRLREMLTYLIEGVRQYPNIIRAHFIGPVLYAKREKELSNLYKTWVQLTMEALTSHVENKSQLRLKFELNMIFSAILMSGLFIKLSSDYSWMNLDDDSECESFINQSLEMLLQ